MRGRARIVLAALAVVGLVAAAALGTTSTANGRASSPAASPTGGCTFANGIKHVIQIQFDNTHFLRDNGNVPSDLEQMPHLLNFIRGNGTLLTNDHTVLISHTATGILSTLTGVYRALSFICLGLVLVAIGWLYQRILFRGRPGNAHAILR